MAVIDYDTLEVLSGTSVGLKFYSFLWHVLHLYL